MPYKKILVSLAGKEDERNVIQEAVRLSSITDAELTAFHVNDPGAGKAHMMMDTLPLITEKDIREQFRKLGYEKEADEIKVNIVAGSSYPNEIAKATQSMDLLVIGHRHKNRFLSAFIDSVDERVADLVSCPVLVVPRQ